MTECPKCSMMEKKKVKMIIGVEEIVCPKCGYSYINTE